MYGTPPEVILTPNCSGKTGVTIEEQKANRITFNDDGSFNNAMHYCTGCVAGEIATKRGRQCTLPGGFEFN